MCPPPVQSRVKSGEVPYSQKNTLFYIFIFDRDKQGEGKPILTELFRFVQYA